MVGIVTLNSDTFTNPTLYSIIKVLNERGIRVILFCGFQQTPIPYELNLTSYADLPKGLFLPRRPDYIFKYIYLFWSAIKFIKKNKIKNLLAVDAFGLVMAGRISTFLSNIKIHYCSFEIFFLDEIKQHTKILKVKKKEIFYSRNLTSIIIQDAERKKLLATENNIKPSFTNWFYVPVSPIIINNSAAKKYQRSNFGLKDTDIVYVHSGSVSLWSGLDSIINAIEEGLPENTFILIHNKNKFDRNDPIHTKLFELRENGANLVLHDELFENYGDYNSFLQCFNYGITIYRPDDGLFTGKNISEIGLASGKLSTYMLAGLPTLLSECTTYRNLLMQYKIGALITQKKSLSYHIKSHSLKLVNKVDCLEFYEKVLNPSEQITHFITHLIK
ncbi:hypothetical protein [Pedobacter rhodius]|nr:hypothetical protein [Pedobacter sp. SJ11]